MKRTVLVTGGAGSLGFASAMALAEEGANVAIADLSATAAEEAAAALPGGPHIGVAIDVSDEASVAEAFDAAESALGPVAVLVTFAGYIGQAVDEARPSLADFDLPRWEKLFAINTRGTFLCLREMARRRRETPVTDGRIITVASAAGQLGGYQANAGYIASKGAVLSLTKGAARDLAPLGITVNSIAPGPIDTPMLAEARGKGEGDKGFANLAMLPAGRIGRPGEIAAAVRYLASVDAGFVTGSTLDINGGLRMQ
ncbi:SDR family NAD(P)-dependent oxidoreductase [Sphingopyxis sp.]|uniref:SDR family NAD(P)-dependent oxidoreductase n=1 Tax=Sphingopyxis sp. TaxID=1908224 RepID=UPI002D792BC4|nr:SDR family NAD(P)-dependent oxidoreductase [Sphingopyxis sp.]HET6526368.1 SDR family NAD(P)-dependent oxidoreductase [Sphingopyxis sp.]